MVAIARVWNEEFVAMEAFTRGRNSSHTLEEDGIGYKSNLERVDEDPSESDQEARFFAEHWDVAVAA